MPRARSAAGEKKCHTNCSRGAVHGAGGKVLNRAESQGLRRKKSWGKMFLHGKIKLSPDGLPSHAKNRRYETNALLVESPPNCDACQTVPSFWFWGRKNCSPHKNCLGSPMWILLLDSCWIGALRDRV